MSPQDSSTFAITTQFLALVGKKGESVMELVKQGLQKSPSLSDGEVITEYCEDGKRIIDISGDGTVSGDPLDVPMFRGRFSSESD